jgi:hypothetical protein
MDLHVLNYIATIICFAALGVAGLTGLAQIWMPHTDKYWWLSSRLYWTSGLFFSVSIVTMILVFFLLRIGK